jgi:hypothetical protein
VDKDPVQLGSEEIARLGGGEHADQQRRDEPLARK